MGGEPTFNEIVLFEFDIREYSHLKILPSTSRQASAKSPEGAVLSFSAALCSASAISAPKSEDNRMAVENELGCSTNLQRRQWLKAWKKDLKSGETMHTLCGYMSTLGRAALDLKSLSKISAHWFSKELSGSCLALPAVDHRSEVASSRQKFRVQVFPSPCFPQHTYETDPSSQPSSGRSISACAAHSR